MNRDDMKMMRGIRRKKQIEDGTYFLNKSNRIPDKKKKQSREMCRKDINND